MNTDQNGNYQGYTTKITLAEGVEFAIFADSPLALQMAFDATKPEALQIPALTFSSLKIVSATMVKGHVGGAL